MRIEILVFDGVDEMDVMFLHEDDRHGSPLGSKGIGELGICGAGAAIMNAIHNATGANVLVAHFAVSHDAVRQADVEPGGLDQGVRIRCMQHVVAWLLRQHDRIGRVLGWIGILAPAVTDNKEDGFTRSAHEGFCYAKT